ncbi:anaerobic ribonucleoside-triphosphate reductase activating protein [Candidatus Bathyarchaeota archaeon RBG_13_60_20]|nr:MAG: anaerobic ribonucleoside-triphosphate reductase activating protein [Candidatus Bathyarchaeota archaeon RBG_13_60_20]
MRIDLPIVGYRMLSLSDYPGCLSASVTVPGCNFRCPFCPKLDLVHHHIPMPKTPPDGLLEVLWPRLGFLDAVSVTGGEPLLHRGLPPFLEDLRRMGFRTKLDTNASRPGMLRHLVDRGLVDYFSVRIVAPLDRYTEVARYKVKPGAMEQSIQIIRRSKVQYEFTFTPVPGFHDHDDMLAIASTLAGSRRMVIRSFKPDEAEECGDLEPFSVSELDQYGDLAAPYFGEVLVEH